MEFDIQVGGLKHVEQNLQRLGSVAGTKVVRQALFRATEPILEQAQANVARIEGGSGALHAALTRTFSVGRLGGGFFQSKIQRGSRFVMFVGPRTKSSRAIALHNLFYGRQIKGIFYGHLVEFGHRIARAGGGYLQKRNRPNGRGAQAIGQVRPQPFLRPALDSKSLQATFIFANEMRRGVERALKRQGARRQRKSA